MFTFIIRRLISLPLVMLAVTVLIVGLMQVLTPEQRAAAFIKDEKQLRNLPLIVKEKGLDKPFFVQYWTWLSEMSQGNLGYSKTSAKPVLQTIQERFPATAELSIYASIPIIVLGVWLGTLSALKKDKFTDQIIRIFAVIGYSLQSFVLGIWLLVIFYGGTGLLPGFGQVSTETSLNLLVNNIKTYTGLITVDSLLNGRFDVFWDAIKHLILPVITLATISCANIIKVMRATMLETINQDYVRTARAKGLSKRAVELKHARRNALLPIVTLGGFQIVGLLNGAVITESIFAYPGIGSWGAQAAVQLDYPAVLGFALFSAFLVVVGNLLVDVIYGIVDPRVRFE